MPGKKLTGKIAPDRIRLMEVQRPPNGIEGYRGLGHASGIVFDIVIALGITGGIAASF